MAETVKETLAVGLAGHTREISIERPADDPPPWTAGTPHPLVGSRRGRVDGPEKASGRAVYTHDVARPGMLFGRIVRSPHAHARVVAVDTSAVPKDVVLLPLQKKEVRYHGEAVLALAASTPAAAEDACHAVRVTWEVLPHAVTVEAARRPDAPLVFAAPVAEKRSAGDAPGEGGAASQKGNVRGPKVSKLGDVEKAFAQADGTLELATSTAVQTHVALETHGAVAEWVGDTLEVWSSTQGTFTVRDELAAALDLSKDKVRVHARFVGGGFGAKFGAGECGLFAAKLAKLAGRPVKLLLDRKEEHQAAGSRPDSRNTIRLAYRKDGTVTAVHYVSFGTAGVATGSGTGSFAKNAYSFPNQRIEESDVFTHLGPGCAMRAPGHPQGCFATESALDALAETLGMDPLALRLVNERSDVRKAEWEEGAKAIGWARRAAMTRANHEAAAAGRPLRRGLGCAGSVWYTIVNSGPQVLVRVHRDGRVEVENGVQEIGGGVITAIALVAAEELGLPADEVVVKIGDSRFPYGPASGGSTTITSLIPAVRAAAVHARAKLLPLAAARLGVPEREVVLAGGSFTAAGRSASFASVCARMAGDSLVATGDRAKDYDGTDARIFGAQFAEVTVDVEAGLVRVERVVAVHDCGQPIWRTGVESQIEGGILQGISYALFEERIVDLPTGRFLNPNVEQYKILGSRDVPRIDVRLVTLWPGKNNAQVRGIGEPATIPTAAAVANAVAHAIGARITDLPITPERVLAASDMAPHAPGRPA